MEFNYFIFIVISVFTSGSAKAFTIISNSTNMDVAKSLTRDKRNMDSTKLHNVVQLPTYSVYLIGFTILFLVIAVIALSVALYLALKKKTIFGLNANNKEYIRQESTGVTPLYNTHYNEENQNNGSTLTMNSGVIEISEPRVSDPITPTRLEDSKIIFAKKPLRPILPVMQRGQMDAICKEVLRKVQKSDSASFRDLNDLLKFEKKEDNFGTKEETLKENKNEEKAELEIKPSMFKLNKKTEVKTEAPNENKTETKDETKHETKNETKENENKIKPDENKDGRIEVNNVEGDKTDGDSDETEYDTVPTPITFRHSHPEADQTLYDTVPSPTKYRHSGPEPDHSDQTEYDIVPRPKSFRLPGRGPDHSDQTEYDIVPRPKSFRLPGPDSTYDVLEDIPLYDLPPPNRSREEPARNVIQMDSESHYLMPISSDNTDSCYVNAKRQPFNAP